MENRAPTVLNENRIKRCRPILGTFIEITLAGHADLASLYRWTNEAFAAIETVHRLMSFQDPHSELSCLNAVAHRNPVPVHPWTRRVIQTACEIGHASDGIFDIAFGSCARGSFRDIVLHNNGAISFQKPLTLDLSGIAKGFAVDRAIDALADKALTHACVNAGGDLRFWSNAAESVCIRDPALPHQCAHHLTMTHPAIATSAPYFHSTIVEPVRRTAAKKTKSVSVLASTCMIADALTKVVMLAPPEEAQRVLQKYGATSLILDSMPA